MRIKLLTASLAAVMGVVAPTSAYAQSGSTNFGDVGTSVVQGGIPSSSPVTFSDGGFSQAPGFSQGPGFSQPQGFSQAPFNSFPQSGPTDPSFREGQAGLSAEADYFRVPGATPAPAAAPAKAKKNPAVGAHKGLFYANDFSYLTPEYNGPRYFGDGLKNLADGRLSIGGELRTRYHSEDGMGQQAGATRFQDTQNEFGLVRLRLYADFKATDRLRFFAEGIYADVIESNGEYVPRGVDINRGDFLNLFADVKVTDNTTVRIGRQELLYGDQRVVSPLDWVNTRQRFDGVRTLSKWGDFSVDAFYTQFVPVQRNEFDTPNEDLDFYGTYATYKGFENKR